MTIKQHCLSTHCLSVCLVCMCVVSGVECCWSMVYLQLVSTIASHTWQDVSEAVLPLVRGLICLCLLLFEVEGFRQSLEKENNRR